MNRNPLLFQVFFAALACVAIGCDRDQEIRTYQAPKETVSGDQGILSSIKQAPTEAQSDALADLQWTLPANWTIVPVTGASGAFQADARISVDPSDPQLLLSVSHLGDAAGARSVVMNVNRWEGQEGLPPTSEADLPKVVQTIQVADTQVSMVDLRGKGTRMLCAIFPHADRTWFFKLTGPEDKVAAHKTQFDEFVRSIHFGSPAPAAEQAVANPAPAPTPAPPGIQWQVPAGWTAEPTTPMLLARLQAGNGGALVKVSSFGVNNFGTLELNLNRWRGEVGLPPVSGADVKDVPETQVGGRSWKVYDFSGPAGADQKRSIIGQTQQGANVYFFKISGPADAVQQQKAAFEQFIASVRF